MKSILIKFMCSFLSRSHTTKKEKEINFLSKTTIYELIYKAYLSEEKAFQNPFSVLRK